MLMLDEFNKSDIPFLLNWLENTDNRFLYQFAGPKYNFPLDDNQLLQTMKSSEYLMFKFIKKNIVEPLGHCQFMRIDHYKSTASVGRLLINPKFRGQGYGLEMLKEMVKYAQDELKLSTLKLRVFEFNKSAIKCYKKIGFKSISTESNIIPNFNEDWVCISMEYKL